MLPQLSTTESEVYRKVAQAKQKTMTEKQVIESLKKYKSIDIQGALKSLCGRAKLLTPSKGPNGVNTFTASETASKISSFTEDQNMLYKMIGKSRDNGIDIRGIKSTIKGELNIQSIRKILDFLEKNGHIKQFSAKDSPTQPRFIHSNREPAAGLTGGIWYDKLSEFDLVLVNAIRGTVLQSIQGQSYPQTDKDTNKDKPNPSSNAKPLPINHCSNPIYSIDQTRFLPTPLACLEYIEKTRVTRLKIKIKDLLEILKSLELDGSIERVKPIGGVHISKRQRALGDDDDGDGRGAPKRRRLEWDNMPEKDKELMKQAAKADKKKAEKKAEKVREKKMRERAEKKGKVYVPDKKKKKKHQNSMIAVEESDADSDALVEVDDIKPPKPSKSTSSKRKRSTSSSNSSHKSSSSSSSSSSDSDDSVSSVSSKDIDLDKYMPKIKERDGYTPPPRDFNPGDNDDDEDNEDLSVIYRAIRPMGIPLGQTQVPCGQCPVFGFCEEGGPVDAVGCKYFGDWLGDVVGGWDLEGLGMYRADRDEMLGDVDEGGEKMEIGMEVEMEGVEGGDKGKGGKVGVGQQNGRGEGEEYDEDDEDEDE